MSHDVFISYSTKDLEIAVQICSSLEKLGLVCWIAPRNIPAGMTYPKVIISAIENTRVVLLVYSDACNGSVYVKTEVERAVHNNKLLMPVWIENIKPCGDLEFFLSPVQRFEAFAQPFNTYLPDLCQQVSRSLPKVTELDPEKKPQPVPVQPTATPEKTAPAIDPSKPRIALLYKRNTQPDGDVLQLLERSFSDAGHAVLVNRKQIGVEWVGEISNNINSADVVIPILSEACKQDEMVDYEIQTAWKTSHEMNGKPRLLPVRVKYEGPISDSLDAILNPLPKMLWNGPQDDAAIFKQLNDALRENEPPAEDAIQQYGSSGAIPNNSKFYIERPSDLSLTQALRRKDTIVLIKGGRQMGKTSLVARGLQEARTSGATVVYTDLQKLNNTDLENIRQFYFALAHILADQMDIDTDIEDTWKELRAPSINFEKYIKKVVLPKANGHLFWALDEVDRLFTTEFGSEVFGLIRSWHNERATDPDTPLNGLTMIIAYATEAHLFIADPNQSPFNVGTKLELRDFDQEQEEALNKLFGNPLFTDDQVTHFYALVNGQPYLVNRGLCELKNSKMSFEELAAVADRDEGPFGDHLRRILVMMCRDQKMIDAVRTVLDGTNTLTMESFYRLRAAGIVVGEGSFNAKMRCLLYANYLRGHLREPA
jgi:hypothetical protein